jgi:tetratricopeptide (TPR) repeat protein
MKFSRTLMGTLILSAISSWAREAEVINQDSLVKDCASLSEKIREANTKLSDSERTIKLTALRDMIRTLKTQDIKKTNLPASYWQSCLNNSVDLLRAHTNSASSALRLQRHYLVLLSELFEIQGSRPQALSFIEDAMKQDSKDPYLRLRAARIWLEIEESKAKDLPKSSKGLPGSQSALKKRLDSYLQPLIKSDSSRSPERLAALHLRASFHESLGDLESAQKDWNSILEIEAKNVKILRKIAAYEYSAGHTPATIATLNKLVDVDPTDLAAQKQLVKIYVDQKDFRAAKSQSRKALKFFPRDEELRSILNLEE